MELRLRLWRLPENPGRGHLGTRRIPQASWGELRRNSFRFLPGEDLVPLDDHVSIEQIKLYEEGLPTGAHTIDPPFFPFPVRRLKKWHIRVPDFKVQVLDFGVGFPTRKAVESLPDWEAGEKDNHKMVTK
jgi:hypothetical protein